MPITIDKCDFGRMSIAGRTYTDDLLILTNGQVVGRWWREAGHHLCLADIHNLVKTQPDIIIVGTGIHGMMRVSEELSLTLSRSGIQLNAMPTPSAAKAFNRCVKAEDKVAGCFHLSC